MRKSALDLLARYLPSYLTNSKLSANAQYWGHIVADREMASRYEGELRIY